jgi:hypothetical protein
MVDEGPLEELRSALRRRDARRTVAKLRLCDVQLAGDAWYLSIRTYVMERLRRSAAPSTAVSGSALVMGDLQKILRWLLREEADLGRQLVRAQRYTEALQACKTAARIDGRCARIALTRAVALSGAHPNSRPTLVEALRWVTVAATDSTLHDECDLLARQIDTSIGRLELAEANQLVTRYNGIIRAYNRPVLYRVEAANMRASMATLGADVIRARRGCRSGTPAARALTSLANAIADIQAQLRI